LQTRLRHQVYRGLHHRFQALDRPRCARLPPLREAAEGITSRFIAALPELRALLATDLEAAYDGDPAATGTDEVIFCYPGLYATSPCYRWRTGFFARAQHHPAPIDITERSPTRRRGSTSIPERRSGKSFFIDDHGAPASSFGGTTVIGERVRIYQGVTLGALSVLRARRAPPRPRSDTRRSKTKSSSTRTPPSSAAER